jgi:hypothetical protein
MPMRTIICGSIAYDTIVKFDGRFRDQILPDRVHMLNVAFLVPQLRREFGGCAGSPMGAIKIEARGTQNHRFTRAEFYSRHQQNFGEHLALASAIA